jgi:HPt (histidine-containing phosphotransfer) domain-containing protein
MEKGMPSWSLEKLRQMSKGNEAFVQKMLAIFLEQTPIRLTEMEKSYAEGNLHKLGEIAHKMKPGMDSFEMTGLLQTVRKLEKAMENSLEENETLLLHLSQSMKQILAEMEKGG